MLRRSRSPPTARWTARRCPRPPRPGPRALVAAPPRSPDEEAVAAVWRQVLARTEVGIHDNFFDLGGHSMLAARLLSRLHDSLRGGRAPSQPLPAADRRRVGGRDPGPEVGARVAAVDGERKARGNRAVSPHELLARLRGLDVRVTTDGTHLRCSAPEGSPHAEELRESDRQPQDGAHRLHRSRRSAGAWGTIPRSSPSSRGDRARASTRCRATTETSSATSTSRATWVRTSPSTPSSRRAWRAPPRRSGACPSWLRSMPTSSARSSPGSVPARRVLPGRSRGLRDGPTAQARGREVSLLVLFGSPCPTALQPSPHRVAAELAARAARQAGALVRRRPSSGFPTSASASGSGGMPRRRIPVDETARRRVAVEGATVDAIRERTVSPRHSPDGCR